jgi:hypothetical protein
MANCSAVWEHASLTIPVVVNVETELSAILLNNVMDPILMARLVWMFWDQV